MAEVENRSRKWEDVPQPKPPTRKMRVIKGGNETSLGIQSEETIEAVYLHGEAKGVVYRIVS
jgi:hypothetical protein